MFAKTTLILLAVLALMTVTWAHPGHDKTTTTDWVPQAELKQLFPEGHTFTVLRVKNPEEFSAAVQKKLGKKMTVSDLSTPMFKAQKRDGQMLGYAWIGVVSLDKKANMLLVGTDAQNKVTGVLLPETTSALAKASFLGQFKGKTGNDTLTDVKAEGAEQTEVVALVHQATVMLALAAKE